MYLYGELAPWAKATLGLESALVTGAGRNRTTIPGLRRDLGSILAAFSPGSMERPPDLATDGELDLLIATDCISEGQNLQDCDWLINYDIHWNPVRIIQRFGRIDRIGSPNKQIQLVNFWPNMELEEYINLEQRVSGRMVLLDVSATGEENLIEQQSGDQMNDLEYRRKQLLKLQDTVIDLEDLSTGVSIADLTLTDFRIDMAQYAKTHPGVAESLPLGTFAVTTAEDADIEPGVVFCLRSERVAGEPQREDGYPLAPMYLVHVGDDGAVVLPYTQAKRILDRLKRLCVGRDLTDDGACARFDRATKRGADMRSTQQLLAAAVASVVGKAEERAVASLFSGGGTHGLKGEFAGINDFEVLAFLVVLAGRRRVRADELIAALDLPKAARVDRRVPKKLLLENGAPTAADRRLIGESIESLVWVAALKPTTVGIPAFVDEIREYLEIAVISVTRPERRQAGEAGEPRAPGDPVSRPAGPPRRTSGRPVRRPQEAIPR